MKRSPLLIYSISKVLAMATQETPNVFATDRKDFVLEEATMTVAACGFDVGPVVLVTGVVVAIGGVLVVEVYPVVFVVA